MVIHSGFGGGGEGSGGKKGYGDEGERLGEFHGELVVV
jgi:hypothetical protein